MASVTKYAPINGGNLISDIKPHFSIFRTKRTVALAYGFVFVFIAFTIFLAFSPSSNSSSPWFTNIFTVSKSNASSSSVFTDESYRSHFSSIYYYFFPNSTSSRSQNTSFLPPISSKQPPDMGEKPQNGDLTHKNEVLKPNNETLLPFVNQTVNNDTTHQPNPSPDFSKKGLLTNHTGNNSKLDDKGEEVVKGLLTNHTGNNSKLDNKGEEVVKQNQSQSEKSPDKVKVLKANQSKNYTDSANENVNSPLKSDGQKVVAEKGVVKNLTSSPMKKQSNGTGAGKGKQGIEDLIKPLINCDFFDGNWVRDESYPLYKPGSCSLIDEQFNCFVNGRPDNDYLKLKWKPKGCTLPRLDGSRMLEMLRGKRLVFVGDSLNRNMWESLICILRNSVKNHKKVYEQSGRHHFRSEASYSFVFEDYKCTVEFFVSPFLVQEWEAADKNGTKKETLRLDLIGSSADKYKHADIIVFNTGHWWTHEKTSKGKDYYQEGSHVYSDLNVLEAFRKALTTWGRWVEANVNPAKSFVFFRGYSSSHFSGGQWNSGGACDHETEPIKNETYLTRYPPKMSVLEKVLKGMKTPVTYLNVTRMSDYRKDGHPSIYRKQHFTEEERRSPLRFQDCSHWCLPGVPDAWNEILYAQLLVKLNQNANGRNLK